MLSHSERPRGVTVKAVPNAIAVIDAGQLSDAQIVEIGRGVIATEGRALLTLAGALDHRFSAAVGLLLEASGRVVFVGVGKSGHIARKLAATCSATGTPACYLDAAGAMHGDLGMLQRGDVLVMLSNSGESGELRPLLRFARSQGLSTIGLTARADTSLMRQMNVTLEIGPVVEVCPFGIAPTTSSTAMLALGDALAVAVMRARGVTKADVIRLHPGGVIGARHVALSALVDRKLALPLVAADMSMREVVLTMTGAGKGIAGVVDPHGDLIGAITDGDLRRSFDHVLTACAGDVMSRDPKVLAHDLTVDNALDVLRSHKITAAFVVDAQRPLCPIGLLNIHDLTMVLGSA